LFVQGSPPSWTEILDRRLRASLGQAHDRVRFLPRMPGPDFLSLIAACEVMLDTTHFCGGHTTYEALAVATPVVTLPSPLLRARLSAGMYAQMQIDEPVAADPQAYVETALRLATQPDARAARAAQIAERRDILFDNQQAVRAHEDFFIENCR
jgi:predicted O-linked N-acetylglucosamine transferase (SPINDLY family)